MPLNQTWVPSPTCSKGDLLTPGHGEGKPSVYCRAPYKESRQLVFKTSQLPDRFQESIFKGQVREPGSQDL